LVDSTESQAKQTWHSLPNWLVSIMLHVGLFLFCAHSLQSCSGENILAQPGEGDRLVGVYLQQAPKSAPQPEQITQSADVPNSVKTPFDVPFTEANELDQPPVPLNLPTSSLPVIGRSGSPSSSNPNNVANLLPNNSISGSPSPQGLGEGETSMFGIRDQGRRFVYVIDSSGSMYGAPIRVARAELIASIQALTRTQQFQVIFYNRQPTLMRLRGDSADQLYRASDHNRAAARDFIYRETPQAGTNHMPALRQALRLNPEVIFFLTDAKEPRLHASDLAEIARINQKRARIHCIEFGKGGDLGLDNFLKKLARQNHGTFRYRDVGRFARSPAK
jgi:Ca-activated chloride channel family protein